MTLPEPASSPSNPARPKGLLDIDYTTFKPGSLTASAGLSTGARAQTPSNTLFGSSAYAPYQPYSPPSYGQPLSTAISPAPTLPLPVPVPGFAPNPMPGLANLIVTTPAPSDFGLGVFDTTIPSLLPGAPFNTAPVPASTISASPFAVPGLTNPAPAPLTAFANPLTTAPATSSLFAAAAGLPTPATLPDTPLKGLLDQSYVKSPAGEALSEVASNQTVLVSNAHTPEVNNPTHLPSPVAGDTLRAGAATTAKYQEATETGDEPAEDAEAEQAPDKDAEPKSLPNISHNPGSRTYTYSDPKTGPRSVTPFVDKIPGFDWHRDRNMFNKIPGKKPHRVYKKVYRDSKQGPRMEDVFSHYEDHQGNRWNPNFRFFTGPYHGKENLSFRGTGQYRGCQAVYTPEGKAMTTGHQRSTFDYGSAPSRAHTSLDVKPHKAPGGGSYRDPDLSRVF